ncbi:MAG: 1-deoxy-D-xylulose-5-phosphate reductoisomerase [Bifidobacteriaceae bacterium]|nr:1-deoxy-D-xylulose-5-phosphate reductoisomerase [Bifidobacteriaceae bacterium]
MRKRKVALLGSTGSIGTQALQVMAAHPDSFEITALAAGAARPRLLASQIARFAPREVALPTDDAAGRLDQALTDLGIGRWRRPRVKTGPEAAAQVAGSGAEVVLNALAGASGLEPTLAALGAGSTLALANKESLVIGGALVNAAAQRPGQIVPVDSEHSAIAQCLRAGRASEVSRLILTASGGPFRGLARDQLQSVTPADALSHPTWSMGPLVTVNSSTLVNKALELIEAHLLFGAPPEQIDVVVHPQSTIHSMVEFCDGSVIAQVSPPDMKLPIALALGWPERVAGAVRGVDWTASSTWTFEPVDDATFPAIGLARRALAASPLHPAVLNGANEVCVEAFLGAALPYLGIVDTVAAVLEDFAADVPPGGVPTLEQVMAADRWARDQARTRIERS